MTALHAMPALSYLTIAYIVGAVFAIIELGLTAYSTSPSCSHLVVLTGTTPT